MEAQQREETEARQHREKEMEEEKRKEVQPARLLLLVGCLLIQAHLEIIPGLKCQHHLSFFLTGV